MKEKDEAAFWVTVWLWVALIASWTTITAIVFMNIKAWNAAIKNTRPQAREPLTDAQLMKISRAIEAAHGIKENT